MTADTVPRSEREALEAALREWRELLLAHAYNRGGNVAAAERELFIRHTLAAAGVEREPTLTGIPLPG